MKQYKKWYEVTKSDDEIKEFEKRSNMPKFQRALDNFERTLDEFETILTNLEKEKLKNAPNDDKEKRSG